MGLSAICVLCVVCVVRGVGVLRNLLQQVVHVRVIDEVVGPRSRGGRVTWCTRAGRAEWLGTPDGNGDGTAPVEEGEDLRFIGDVGRHEQLDVNPIGVLDETPHLIYSTARDGKCNKGCGRCDVGWSPGVMGGVCE